MENSNKLFDEILSKLQEYLKEYKCNSEVKISEKEAILYGKFSQNLEKYTVVVHLKEANYVPVTVGTGSIRAKEEDDQKYLFPSLDLQYLKGQKANCSQEEQTRLKNKFMEDAAEIGKTFIRNLDK